MSTELITTSTVRLEQGAHRRSETPLQPKQVWSIRICLEMSGDLRDLALFNMAIDS